MPIPTPYYLIDKAALQANLEQAARLRALSGAKILLALKCFATWPLFELMRRYHDGTTSSSLYELQLGHDKFGGETHAYCVAWADHEIDAAVACADKVIFNSVSQLQRLGARAASRPRGLRLNPGVSASSFDLADPARPYSRLGESDAARVEAVLDQLDGLQIHNNCENRDFARFDALLGQMEQRFAPLLARVAWVSLGGGIHFTAPGYPLEALAARLARFAERHGVQVYLEPGEALVQDSASLEVTVLDTLVNGKQLAVVDAATEAHMPDLLLYGLRARIEPDRGAHRIRAVEGGDLAHFTPVANSPAPPRRSCRTHSRWPGTPSRWPLPRVRRRGRRPRARPAWRAVPRWPTCAGTGGSRSTAPPR